MKLEIKIDTQKVIAAFIKAPQVMRDTIRPEMATQMEDLARYARNNANFKYEKSRPTGNLARSITTSVSPSGLTGTVEINHTQSSAPYGRRVHEGGGGKRDRLGRKMTNAPNKFLYRAMDSKKNDIVLALSKSIGDAFRKIGF